MRLADICAVPTTFAAALGAPPETIKTPVRKTPQAPLSPLPTHMERPIPIGAQPQERHGGKDRQEVLEHTPYDVACGDLRAKHATKQKGKAARV